MQGMLTRKILPTIRARLDRSPAVALLGPRQCGKTTLAGAFSAQYFDMEREADRLRLDVDWNTWVDSDEIIVLDEAQEWPELFPRLRGAIDADRGRYGRFLLLGSIAPGLMHHVSESLAGRLALVELSPLSLAELPEGSIEDLWLRGGYPELWARDASLFPSWHRDYLRLLSERDLPNWGLPAKPQVSQRLFRMLAAVHGQLVNASQLATSLGISAPTVRSYVDYLEGAFLVRQLPPYFTNLKKRVVKSPKCFWRDSGLLHATWGVSTRDELLAHPLVGSSWEGFVIEQILTQLRNLDRHVVPYHFRTSDGIEIDLVLDFGTERWAVKTKLTSNPGVDDMNRLRKAAQLIDASKRVLISRTSTALLDGDDLSSSLPSFLEYLRECFD